jgi:hypothetical protein
VVEGCSAVVNVVVRDVVDTRSSCDFTGTSRLDAVSRKAMLCDSSMSLTATRNFSGALTMVAKLTKVGSRTGEQCRVLVAGRGRVARVTR